MDPIERGMYGALLIVDALWDEIIDINNLVLFRFFMFLSLLSLQYLLSLYGGLVQKDSRDAEHTSWNHTISP